MKRFAAHWLYCSPEMIISKGVVELDNDNCVQQIFSLKDSPSEIHSTIFLNGIIVPFFLNQRLLSDNNNRLVWEVLDEISKQLNSSMQLDEKANLWVLEDLDLSAMRITSSSYCRSIL